MAISSAVDPSRVARVTGIKTSFIDLRQGAKFLPQQVAVVGQGSDSVVYADDPVTVLSSTDAGNVFGFGSPVHLAVDQLLPTNGDGVGGVPVTVYPLQADGSGVAAVGEFAPTGTATGSFEFKVAVNNIETGPIVVATGDDATAVSLSIANAITEKTKLPVVAGTPTTACPVTSKWLGASANALKLAYIVPVDTKGITFAATNPTGGAANPDVTAALNNVGNKWEAMVVNCMNYADSTALDVYQTFGEGRWGALVKKPLAVFTGSNVDLATVTAVTDARKDDRINSIIPNAGSDDLPFIIAARAVARVAVVANANPAQDYGSQQATGLTAGTDWNYNERDFAVKSGCSTVENRDGVVTLADIITTYHPTGDETPAYRYVVDIVKLQQVIYNLDLTFTKPEWDGAPLIADGQPTVNQTAKTPSMAKAEVASIIDQLALEAVLANPEAAKESILVEIDSNNAKRLNISFTVQLSGNTNIKSIDLNFGFYFGG